MKSSRPSADDAADPFEVIGDAPKGQAYQWIALTVFSGAEHTSLHLDHMKAGGWKPVPRSRHPRIKSEEKKRIVVRGQMLCQRSVKLGHETRKREIDAALDQAAQKDQARINIHGWMFPRLPEKEVIAQVYDTVAIRAELEAIGGKIPVTIAIRLSDQEIDAAAACHLTAVEYARRKVLMIKALSAQYVLAPAEDSTFEFATLTLSRSSDGSR